MGQRPGESRDDNSVIVFQYIINCGPLCSFTDTPLCKLGRYRLQIWEEPLQKCLHGLSIIVHPYTRRIVGQFSLVPGTLHGSFSLIRAREPEPTKTAHPGHSAVDVSLIRARGPCARTKQNKTVYIENPHLRVASPTGCWEPAERGGRGPNIKLGPEPA